MMRKNYIVILLHVLTYFSPGRSVTEGVYSHIIKGNRKYKAEPYTDNRDEYMRKFSKTIGDNRKNKAGYYDRILVPPYNIEYARKFSSGTKDNRKLKAVSFYKGKEPRNDVNREYMRKARSRYNDPDEIAEIYARKFPERSKRSYHSDREFPLENYENIRKFSHEIKNNRKFNVGINDQQIDPTYDEIDEYIPDRLERLEVSPYYRNTECASKKNFEFRKKLSTLESQRSHSNLKYSEEHQNSPIATPVGSLETDDHTRNSYKPIEVSSHDNTVLSQSHLISKPFRNSDSIVRLIKNLVNRYKKCKKEIEYSDEAHMVDHNEVGDDAFGTLTAFKHEFIQKILKKLALSLKLENQIPTYAVQPTFNQNITVNQMIFMNQKERMGNCEEQKCINKSDEKQTHTNKLQDDNLRSADTNENSHNEKLGASGNVTSSSKTVRNRSESGGIKSRKSKSSTISIKISSSANDHDLIDENEGSAEKTMEETGISFAGKNSSSHETGLFNSSILNSPENTDELIETSSPKNGVSQQRGEFTQKIENNEEARTTKSDYELGSTQNPDIIGDW